MRHWHLPSPSPASASASQQRSLSSHGCSLNLPPPSLDLDLDPFSPLLRILSSDKSLPDLRLLHSYLVAHDIHGLGSYSNRLIRAYGLCGSHTDSLSLFFRMPRRDSHTWRFMIGAYAASASPADALQLFRQMIMEGVLPVKVTVISVLSACVGENYLVEGKRIHAFIAGSCDLKHDMEVGNTIISMYGRCHCLPGALDFFHLMPSHNVVSLNTAITALVHDGMDEEALDLFSRMKLFAILPNDVTYISALSACATMFQLPRGKIMHACAQFCAFVVSEAVLGNALLNMYGKCGKLEEARSSFCKMPSQNVASWNCMITSHLQLGKYDDAFELFIQMQTTGSFPNNITLTDILSACAGQNSIEEGRRLHSRISGAKSASDPVLGTALINMYGKCGNLEDACRVFQSMANRDVIMWNAMIEIYVKFGEAREAIELFEKMEPNGLMPTKVTFINVLNAFTDLQEAKHIHMVISNLRLEIDVIVATSLMNMYSKCCSIEDVFRVFDKILERDLISWNAALAAIVRHGAAEDLLLCFQEMLAEGVLPDKFSYKILCDACGIHTLLKEGKRIHATIVGSQLDTDFQLRNSAINMYGKCGSLSLSKSIFGDIVEQDETSWNAIIASCAQAGRNVDAIQLYYQMQEEGFMPGKFTYVQLISGFTTAEYSMLGKQVHACMVGSNLEADVIISNALITMYGKCDNLNDAQIIFDANINHDVVTWNGMIATYSQCENEIEALQLFRRMLLIGITPDVITFISLVSVCASGALLTHGKQIHARILGDGFNQDINLQNALISMYGKCGNIEGASVVFGNMRERDVISWNAIITAFACCGLGQEALNLFEKMQQYASPNRATYLIILSACSHSGLQIEGLFYFVAMIEEQGIKPTEEHYNCVIDLLGRAGLLDEAEGILCSSLYLDSALAWTTLLSFCKLHCNEERGERAATNALHREPENGSLYILISNVCASNVDNLCSLKQ